MARFFIDLDGVLADFDGGVVSLLGMSPREFQELHGDRVFWKRLEEADEFYVGLDWLAGARDMLVSMLSLIEAGGDVPMILTGLPLGTWAAPQKRAWCDARPELLGVPVITCLSKDKPIYCSGGDVLLDDREEARVGWEAAGGVFMWHQDPERSLVNVAARYG